jgi:hypothetical protein
MAERPGTEAMVQAVGSEQQARKPYATPALRRLGSVRELTLGSTVGCSTEASPKFPRKKGM